MGSKASSESKNKWNEKAYDRLNVVVQKGEKDIIKAAAERQGKSLNAFVVEAVKEKMERHG